MSPFALQPHPAVDLFPMLPDGELSQLAADIKANGLRQPIVVIRDGDRDLVLDGRNRLRACQIAGVEPSCKLFSGTDPVAFVLSTNLHRRHLNESQRAMVAVAVERMYAATAKERMRAGKKDPTADLREGPDRKQRESSTKAATALNVSPRLVQEAKRVEAKAAPEVAAAVKAGRVAVSDAARIVDAPKARQAALVASVDAGAAKTLKEALQKATKAEVVQRINAEPAPLPAGPFRVIVADPPWAYEKRSEDATHRGANPYPTMTTAEICAMPVMDRAHEDAILWLWTTNAFMRDAFDVLDAWGFAEKTILTWAKNRMGTGDWLRGQTEHCIMAVRGKPVVKLTNQTTLLTASMREHSRKPDEFYTLVEALCPGSKLEIFAREARNGWAAWGAESEKFTAA